MKKKSTRRPLRARVARVNLPAEQKKFRKIVSIIEKYGDDLRRYPDVVNVRPGYRFKNGWFAEPAKPVIGK